MKKHIEKLKKRPQHERKKLAIIFAIATTFIIIILWFILLSVFKTPEKNKKIYDFSKLEKSFDGLADQFLNIENQYKEGKENFKAIQDEIEMNIENEASQLEVDELKEQDTVLNSDIKN